MNMTLEDLMDVINKHSEIFPTPNILDWTASDMSAFVSFAVDLLTMEADAILHSQTDDSQSKVNKFMNAAYMLKFLSEDAADTLRAAEENETEEM